MERPFECLGYNQDRYYYKSHATGHIISLKPPGHNQLNLFMFAPMEWWQENFPSARGGRSNYVNWRAAANYMIQECRKAGAYIEGEF